MATKSLPYALATAAPDLALALDPGNPVALLVKAEWAREALADLLSAETARSREHPAAAAPAAVGEGEPAREQTIERLRGEIHDLALKAIEADPLNAHALRLMAETSVVSERVRSLMRAAITRSRRESAALFWLLNDSFFRRDYSGALDNADLLLRTRPELGEYVFSYFADISRDKDGRSLLVQKLVAAPAWRSWFLQSLPSVLDRGGLAVELLHDLKAAGSPAKGQDLGVLLSHLVDLGRADEAYNLWLDQLPSARRTSLGLVTNAAFENDPDGSPFDWTVGHGLNALAEIAAVDETTARALHIVFNEGRVQAPDVRQTILLGAGRFVVSGRYRGKLLGPRGLRWQLACAGGTGQVLGQSDALLGRAEEWQRFSFQAEIPAGGCTGQVLRLRHDARSASEEFLSGEAWFTGFEIEREPAPS